MKIKDAVYTKETIEVNRIQTDTVYGCDNCRKEIEAYPNEPERLEIIQLYHDDRDTVNLHFCSWDCVLEYMPQAKTDYFINLPRLNFDEGNGPKSGYRLIELLSKLKDKNNE